MDKIDWVAVAARDYRGRKDEKQAELLVERFVAWSLFERIGVHNDVVHNRVEQILGSSTHKPVVGTLPDWYY